uniref:Putative 3-methyladenine DNA glycosylase n=1 Tax=uncultured Bacteroidota bacterium TaxID=152509 RepID=H5SM95_9BACT|nr:DNA-3-methyladenine glycosylase [uncultured Bacteroidetes bacterium]
MGEAWEPVHSSFFLSSVWEVAQGLLGKVLVTRLPEGEAAVRITEVEAYAGTTDRACHAYGGRYTPRTAPMYAEGGTLYIYLCYGIHNLLNIVTGPAGDPCAVLIRAGEPLYGIDLMRLRRKGAPLSRLTVGPGALTQALGIPLTWSGQSLLHHPNIALYQDGFSPPRIGRSPRIGVAYAGPDALHPWRYYVESSPFVSQPPTPKKSPALNK